MCNIEKQLSEYAKKRVKKNGEVVLQYHCRTCQSIRSKENYEKNKKVYIKNSRNRNKEYRKLIHSLLIEYLKEHFCVDCDEQNPIVLEFDHVRGKKKMSISNMISHGKRWEEIKSEIEKCEVRCANCHRIKTASRGNWNKLLMI